MKLKIIKFVCITLSFLILNILISLNPKPVFALTCPNRYTNLLDTFCVIRVPSGGCASTDILKNILGTDYCVYNSAAPPAPGPGGSGGTGGCTGFSNCLQNINVSGLSGFTNPSNMVTELIHLILPFVFGIAGFASVILIIISGIQFITSSGDPNAAGAARGRLIYALIGFAIIILAFAILQIVNYLFLGSNVV